MSDWRTAVAQAANVLADRATHGQDGALDRWCEEPVGAPATVGLFVADGALQLVACRDFGEAGWRVLGGSRRIPWDVLVNRCRVLYRHEAPLALMAVGRWMP